VPTPLPITDRPVRIAVAGLGQIAELCLPPYGTRGDVEIVGLCDLDPGRIAPWANRFPSAATTTDLDELLRLDADVIDVLVPTPYHCEVVTRCLDAGFHVQVQKPLARSLDDADRMVAAAARTGAVLRVLEDYVCFPPLTKLREVVESGEIGPAQALHMKIVATARGGWDVNPASYECSSRRRPTGTASSRSTTAGTSSRSRTGCSARSGACSAGSVARSSPAGSCSTCPRPSCGSTRTACARCSTS
jgi:hypothetical protein